jgi:hypothetical protein
MSSSTATCTPTTPRSEPPASGLIWLREAANSRTWSTYKDEADEALSELLVQMEQTRPQMAAWNRRGVGCRARSSPRSRGQNRPESRSCWFRSSRRESGSPCSARNEQSAGAAAAMSMIEFGIEANLGRATRSGVMRTPRLASSLHDRASAGACSCLEAVAPSLGGRAVATRHDAPSLHTTVTVLRPAALPGITRTGCGCPDRGREQPVARFSPPHPCRPRASTCSWGRR